MRGKKAITSTLAILLLGTLTVTASGAAFYWLSVIQEQIETENNLNIERFEAPFSEIVVIATNYDSTGDKLTLFLENKGNNVIDISKAAAAPTTIWLLKDVDNNVICSTDWSGNNNAPEGITGMGAVEPGELRKVVLTGLSENSLCDVESKAEQELLKFTIDFSGKALSVGSFIR